jgi:hypothetical protein
MNPRELRLLKILMEEDKVFLEDLRQKVGALNPAQVKFSLKKKGWIIHTTFISMKDRDGNDCRPGYYWMDLQEKEKVRNFLEKVNGAAATAPSTTETSKFNTLKFIQNYNNNKR